MSVDDALCFLYEWNKVLIAILTIISCVIISTQVQFTER